VWILGALFLALPVALLARQVDRFPSTIVCTNARPSAGSGNCVVHDAQSLGTITNVPCEDTPAALEAFLDSPNPLRRPFISATQIGPATPELLKKSATLPSGQGIDASAARALLRECVSAPKSPMPTVTVQLIVLERDFTWSLVVFLGALLGTLVAAVRRRVAVTIDPSSRVLRIVERRLFAPEQTTTVTLNDVDDVVVGVAPTVWRRAELVLRSGERVPLTADYVVLARGVHERFAARLRAAIATTRPHL
jgi:hypothetical protein